MLRAALLLSLLPLAASAQEAPVAPAPGAAAVFEALRLPALIDVLAAEGVASSEELGQSLFGPNTVPAAWTETVAGIYDPDAMREEALAGLEGALEGEDTAAMLAFFEGETGRELVALELAAREAMLDEVRGGGRARGRGGGRGRRVALASRSCAATPRPTTSSRPTWRAPSTPTSPTSAASRRAARSTLP
jgi:hypothetical protein